MYVVLEKVQVMKQYKSTLKIKDKTIHMAQLKTEHLSGQDFVNRLQAQKHKLPKLLDNFNATKTESQNMIDNHWLKIYDCGNLKLEFLKQ